MQIAGAHGIPYAASSIGCIDDLRKKINKALVEKFSLEFYYAIIYKTISHNYIKRATKADFIYAAVEPGPMNGAGLSAKNATKLLWTGIHGKSGDLLTWLR